ncbi:hypothetical protein B0J12DRAFT_152684 [Macrophomina phaseolina]|uniref:Arrestin-like N-terminal domain-containing protein n=1 Tax=Macrophomina phaseolina TaxID=35725 RepID=A0ABQ8G558_9PEZI|nr:hypothetical protein B0J12DRAFT_152684 [Macrophomina phaseolina]
MMASQGGLQLGPLQLRLSPQADPLHFYTCGDSVRGEVQVAREEKARKVQISFKAKSRSAMCEQPEGPTEELSIDLFCYTTELFAFTGEEVDALSEKGRTHVSFPFEFQFPWVVGLPAPGHRGEPLQRSDDFENLRGHALPPSFHAKCNGAPQSIEYMLEASLATTALARSTRRVEQSLPFIPPCPCPHPPARAPISRTTELARRHHRLDPRLAAQHAGFRTRIKHLLAGPDPARPSVTFALTATAPARLRAGHALSSPGGSGSGIALALTHLDRSASVPRAPSVALRSFRVTLRGCTALRLPPAGAGAKERRAESWSTEWEVAKRCDGAQGGPPPVLLEDCGVVELGRLCGGPSGLVVPLDVVPGFRSYALKRTYELQVVLWVQCVGKMYEVEAVRHEVEVLPSVCREQEGGVDEGVVEVGVRRGAAVRRRAVGELEEEEEEEEEDEVLPLYHAPPGYEP